MPGPSPLQKKPELDLVQKALATKTWEFQLLDAVKENGKLLEQLVAIAAKKQQPAKR